MTKQLGVIRNYSREKGFGFCRDAQVDFQGNVVPLFGRQYDHYFGTKTLQRSGLAPDAIHDDMIVRFNTRPSQRFADRTEAADIEIVDANDEAA